MRACVHACCMFCVFVLWKPRPCWRGSPWLMQCQLTLLSAPLSTSCAQGRREQTSISSSSSKVLFELMQLPVHLLCEVLSYCPNASTANALTSTCKELRRLRSNPVAKALALVRHDFSSQDAAVYALRAFHMLCSPCGTDLLVAMVPANLEKVSGHLLHALVMMFTDGRNTAMLQKLLPLPPTDSARNRHGLQRLDSAGPRSAFQACRSSALAARADC